MINDISLQFSSAQAITASAASTNALDLGITGTAFGCTVPMVRDIGRDPDIELAIDVVQTFAGLTTLQVAIQTSPDGANWTTSDSGATVPLSSLVAGYQFKSPATFTEGTSQRYVRLFYTVTGGPASAGAISASVVSSRQTNLSWGAQ